MTLLFERIAIEGICPERAVNRLKREGINVYRAKKTKKNQILLTVRKKDCAKVFAFFPNICYNTVGKERGTTTFCPVLATLSPYTARPVGAVGLYAWLTRLRVRAGIVLGGVVFLLASLFCDLFVFDVRLKGDAAYAVSVGQKLEENGISRYSFFPRGKEKELSRTLLTLSNVDFASVKKVGTVLYVEIRSAFSPEEYLKEGDMFSCHDGTIVSLSVLRGTAVVTIGQKVSVGEMLVASSFSDGTETKNFSAVIAKVTISRTLERVVCAETEEDALGMLLPETEGGKIVSRETEKTEEGFLVKIVYEVTESRNF